MKLSLTAEERRWLDDPKTLGNRPLRLENRTVSGGQILAVTFERASLVEVEFREVTFEGTHFSGVRLEHVSFVKCTFQNVSFENSTIVEWSIEETELQGVRFQGCTIEHGRTKLAQFAKLSLEDCVIKSWEDDHGEFTAASLRQVTFNALKWKATRFEGGQLERVTVEIGKFEKVSFTDTPVHGLSLRSVELRGLEFLYGEVSDLAIERARAGPCGFLELKCRGLRISKSDLALVSFDAVKMSGAVVEDCSDLQLFTIMQSEVEAIHFARSGLQGTSLRKSRVFGKSSFDACTIAGLELSEARIEDLVIRRSTLDGPIKAEKAILLGLQLDHVNYGAHYRLLDQGAVHPKGDRFPAKP